MAFLQYDRLLHCLIFFTVFPSGTGGSCYFPDGTLSLNDIPCVDNTAHSACCGQGYACLSNGICQATGQELKRPGATEFVRGSCTDKDWRSSGCPLFCNNPTYDNVGGGEGLSKCKQSVQDTYYCINAQNDQKNCETGEHLLYFPGKPSIITTIGVRATSTVSSSARSRENTSIASSSSPTVSAVRQPTDSVSQQPTATSTSEPSSSNGAVIGGAVGGSVIGIAIIAAISWWVIKKQRTRTNAVQDVRPSNTQPEGAPAVYEAPCSGVYMGGDYERFSKSAVRQQPVYEAP